jgi:hypothetical protein
LSLLAFGVVAAHMAATTAVAVVIQLILQLQ